MTELPVIITIITTDLISQLTVNAIFPAIVIGLGIKMMKSPTNL